MFQALITLIEIHDKICDVIGILNKIFMIPQIFIFAQIFVFGIISLFSAYRTIFDDSNEKSLALAYVNFFWVAYYVLVLYTVIRQSEKSTYAGIFTGTQVHKIINKIQDYADGKLVERVRNTRH